MPGGDGTGPMGMGPMTGGGRGYCAVPLGRSFGRGRGWGRGYGRRRGWFGSWPYMSGATPQQEADMLREEARFMQDEIQSINQRIGELESAMKKAK
ncbi:MAG: DUF5320 family protein [Candidatus Omnitrophica bacterium]|nr:DUF5320 family protein [Candidatus Omnitrophota bacterium]